MKTSIFAGLMSKSIFHSHGIVTFWPAKGITPLGHWVALLQILVNVYLMHYPGGAGHFYRQGTAVMFMYSLRDLD